ncbi:MAG: NAD(+)/NADH kinase [Verrucomicrobia bacterium]|jgi:NAD+ kinase|nr:NAD(+)/NADH kinase [Verrucomicrobiota bacterium]
MKTLGVIANCSKPRAASVLRALAEHAGELGLVLRASGETAMNLPGIQDEALEDVFEASDAIVALGGDGTMLRAVRERKTFNTPLIGVNIGSLGFMTSVAEQDLRAALECLRDETFVVSERCVAECSVSQAGGPGRYFALNDVVVNSGQSRRVITLDVAVGGHPVTSYVCDGLIVSTPTGSTGHSLSAGGPILTPDTEAFVISLICPHTLSSRPLVVPDTSEIRICVGGQSGEARLSVDGQVGLTLGNGSSVVVKRSAENVRFLHLPDYDYFDVLRQKLRWRGSNV